jgi:hypothetical protein
MDRGGEDPSKILGAIPLLFPPVTSARHQSHKIHWDRSRGLTLWAGAQLAGRAKSLSPQKREQGDSRSVLVAHTWIVD